MFNFLVIFIRYLKSDAQMLKIYKKNFVVLLILLASIFSYYSMFFINFNKGSKSYHSIYNYSFKGSILNLIYKNLKDQQEFFNFQTKALLSLTNHKIIEKQINILASEFNQRSE
jgi:hypothetical protein